MTLEKNVKQVAQQLAATKIANGASLEGLTFEQLTGEIEARILVLASDPSIALAAMHAPATSKHPKVRKAKPKATPSTGGSISPESLEDFLRLTPGKTLGEIATVFAVSDGVAKRAIKALGAKGLTVVEGKAEPEPGKKGKRPTTYSIQG